MAHAFDTLSRIRKSRSNLDKREFGRSTFSDTLFLLLYLKTKRDIKPCMSTGLLYATRHSPAIQGIGRSEHRCPGIEGGGDACLGDGDGLLLHYLVNSCAICLLHLLNKLPIRARMWSVVSTLSNSSIQHMPLSASTKAPPSSARSPVNWSVAYTN